MQKNRLAKFLILSLAMLSVTNVIMAGNKDNCMWVKLMIASGTADFRINIPEDGCLSIIATVAGRQQTERLWGPRLMKKGTYKLALPAGRVENRIGTVELFNIAMIPQSIIGSRGSGERQFNNPTGIDLDKIKNEILIADTGNDRIVRLAADGRFIAQHGGFGITFGDRSEEKEDSLDDPYDVAVGGFSNFYISDHNNERICIFDSYRSYKGNLYPKSDDRRNRLSRPRGIKVDSENYIWVVEGRSDKVLKISPTGDKVFELGGFGFGTMQLKDPTQIDINDMGEIFIADRGRGRIAVFDRLGSFLYEIKDHLQSPSGIAVDTDGLILVCDEATHELGLYLNTGQRLSFINRADDQTPLRRPGDIAISATQIFLLDSGNHRLVRIERKKSAISVPWQATSAVLE